MYNPFSVYQFHCILFMRQYFMLPIKALIFFSCQSLTSNHKGSVRQESMMRDAPAALNLCGFKSVIDKRKNNDITIIVLQEMYWARVLFLVHAGDSACFKFWLKCFSSSATPMTMSSRTLVRLLQYALDRMTVTRCLQSWVWMYCCGYDRQKHSH